MFSKEAWTESALSFHRNLESAYSSRTPELFAVVVIAVHPEGFLLADIRGRGWCAPSGRIEPGEAPEEAALRELREEAGAAASAIIPIGYYRLVRKDEPERRVAVFAAAISSFEKSAPGHDSLRTRLFAFQDLPRIYGEWKPLYAEVFQLGRETILASGALQP